MGSDYRVRVKTGILLGASPEHIHLDEALLGLRVEAYYHRVIVPSLAASNVIVVEGSADCHVPPPGPGAGGVNGIDFVDGGVSNDKIVNADAIPGVTDFVTLEYQIGGTVRITSANLPANNGTYVILAISTTSVANDTLEIAPGSIVADADDTNASLEADAQGSWAVIGTLTNVPGYVNVNAEPQWPCLRIRHVSGSQTGISVQVISKHVPVANRMS